MSRARSASPAPQVDPHARSLADRASSRADGTTPSGGLTARQAAIAIGVGLVLLVLCGVLIRHVELVVGNYVSNGAPPLLAFFAVLLLGSARPLLRRAAPRLVPSRAQILLIYAMLTVGVVLMGLYHIRSLLPHLIAMQYWSKDTPALLDYSRLLPWWYAPSDREAVRRYYEGSVSGEIPWDAWAVPLVAWGLFIVAIFVAAFSMVTLVHRQWVRNERLSFPLLTIPLAIASEDDRFSLSATRGRRLLFLAGFGLAAAFNGVNIAHVLYPPVPSLTTQLQLYPYFPDRPWTPLQAVTLYYMIEGIGIGYFVPLEITFSAWFFYAMHRAIAVAGTAAGYDEPGFPFVQEQCSGGYFAVGLILLWSLRRSLAASLRRALRRRSSGPDEPSDRLAWLGLIGSAGFVLGFAALAGMSMRLALPFFAIIGLWALVYARIRAETGVPFMFVFPDGMAKDIFVNSVGYGTVLSWGGLKSMVLLTTLNWVSRFHLPFEQAAYQMDASKLADEARIRRRYLFAALLLALVVGLVVSYWAHLSANNLTGANLIPSAGTVGEYRATVARQEYEAMASRIAMPPVHSMPRLVAASGGFLFVSLLSMLRRTWLGFPFHPLGYLLATALGDTGTNWFPLFVAWLCKGLILRYGGLPLYRRGIPFFLGIAIGHFLVGGVLWPISGIFLSREVTNAYHLVFGE